jgi:chromosome segregation ATPase
MSLRDLVYRKISLTEIRQLEAEIVRLRAEIERLRADPLRCSLQAFAGEMDAKDAEIERLQGARAGDQQRLFHYEAEIERLRAIITRGKDALLDGQSPQWAHDILVQGLTGCDPGADKARKR